MKNREARAQLCKMVNEMSQALGIDECGCTCGDGLYYRRRDVPDSVIKEMWIAIGESVQRRHRRGAKEQDE